MSGLLSDYEGRFGKFPNRPSLRIQNSSSYIIKESTYHKAYITLTQNLFSGKAVSVLRHKSSSKTSCFSHAAIDKTAFYSV